MSRHNLHGEVIKTDDDEWMDMLFTQHVKYITNHLPGTQLNRRPTYKDATSCTFRVRCPGTGQYAMDTVAKPQVSMCDHVVMVTRDEWGARDSRSISLLEEPVGIVFIHHTSWPRCRTLNECSAQMKLIQDFHMDTRGWDDIGYSFLVGEDGRAYEARGWERVGAHTKSWNDVSLAVSIMGDFTATLPDQTALDTVKRLISCGVERGYIRPDYKLYGHRDTNPKTECPGDRLYAEIRTWSHSDLNPPVHPNRPELNKP